MTSTALTALAALLLTQPPAALPAASAPLTVEVVGFESPRGKVHLALFRSKDGFPTDFSKAFRMHEAPVTGEQVVVTLEGLEPGIWAIAVYHDENANNALDTNFLGIPKEGLGVSNDAKGRFGPPKLEGARFELDGTPRRLRITLRYL